jgi:hypothetical protein
MPVRHLDMQAAMKTHWSQSTGAGALDGQHGISLAISSVIADGDIASVIACIEASEDTFAMTGWEIGANTSPAITRVASSRRMAKLYFTGLGSHKPPTMESPRGCTSYQFCLAALIKSPTHISVRLPVGPANDVH